jgi:hypothetical protein
LEGRVKAWLADLPKKSKSSRDEFEAVFRKRWGGQEISDEPINGVHFCHEKKIR